MSESSPSRSPRVSEPQPPTRSSWWPPPPERLAVVVWGLVVLGITVAVLIEDQPREGVYRVFLRAADDWLAGLDTYEPHERYRYPPIATVVFAGLQAIGELLGSVVWRWINIASYLGAVLWALRSGFPAPLARRGQALALLLMVLPSLTSLSNGQANGIVAGGLIAAAVAIGRHRQRLAALLVTGPIAFKLYPVAFAMVAGLLHPRRFVAWLVLGLGACTALPYLLQDTGYVTSQYQALYELLRAEDRTADPQDAYRDLRLVLFHAGTPISNRTYLWIQLAAGTAIAGLCLLGRSAGWSARRCSAFALALTTCWMLVLGFATEKATYILATPILCWLIAHAGARGDRRRLWFLLAVYALFLLPIFVPGSLRRAPIARSVLPAATVALMIAISWWGIADVAQRLRAGWFPLSRRGCEP